MQPHGASTTTLGTPAPGPGASSPGVPGTAKPTCRGFQLAVPGRERGRRKINSCIGLQGDTSRESQENVF